MKGVAIERSGAGEPRSVRLETTALRARLDLERLELRIVAREEPGCALEVRTEAQVAARRSRAGELDLPSRRVLAVGEMGGRGAQPLRVEAQAFEAGAPGVRWWVLIERGTPELRLGLALENRSPAPLALRSLAPLSARLSRFGAACQARGLRVKRPWPELPVLALTAGGRARAALAVGFLRSGAHPTSVRVDTGCGRKPVLWAGLEAAKAPLWVQPGATLETGELWLAFGGCAEELLARWAERAGAAARARIPAHAVVGVRVALEAPEAGSVLARLAEKLPGPLRVRELRPLVVWEKAPGRAFAVDELAPDSARLRRLAEYARSALASDLRAGVRLALDPNDAGALERGQELLARLRALGFEGFEIEPPLAQSLAKPRAARAFERLREALGEGAVLAVRAAPSLAGVATIDILEDAGEERSPSPARVRGAPPAAEAPCSPATERLERTLRLAPLGQRLWRLAFAPRPEPGQPGARARWRTQLSLAALAGDAVLLRHRFASLPRTWRSDLARTLPPLARPRQAVGEAAGGTGLLVPLPGERWIVLLVNLGRCRRGLGVELDALGLEGRFHVFDFWPARYLGVAERRIAPAPAAAGGCRVLGLARDRPCPQLVGSTLHIGLGTIELATLRREPDGGVRLGLRRPGRHAGRLWIALPEQSRPLERSVRFRDRFETVIGTGADD